MTYYECEEFYDFYNKKEKEKIEIFFKLFAYHNLESSLLAHHGDKNSMSRYIDGLREEKIVEENNPDDQFKGVDFGK